MGLFGYVVPIGIAAFAASSVVYAQAPCEVAAQHGIANCRSERITLRAGEWQGHMRLVSDVLVLDPARLYWACCTTDAAGNPSGDLRSAAFLIVLPDARHSAVTEIENCAAAIDLSVDRPARPEGSEAVWAPGRSSEAMIVGWLDQALVDRPSLCRSAPPQVDGTAPTVGTVLVVSVPADSLPDGE